ncbi:pilus assembly protein TadG-related protein [uncultured Sphingomonas sp.]|uniref:pilus assembly protein TadG-related protein n=1 Tax=uncultured Sphingomonas sp. TaxID=158754 RepID=UPI0025F33043|nr:pilus assembly protein TadG-related protein [uncultured Sphingomonas sp.]
MQWLKRLFAAENGSIAIMGAFSLLSAFGMSALAVEAGNAYSIKVQNQRVADIAALAAAMAYKNNPTANVITATAQDVAIANGLPRASTTAALSSDQSQVVVTINTTMPLVMAKMMTTQLAIPLQNQATASLAKDVGSACVGTLSNNVPYGIILSGGAKLSTSGGCSIGTNAGMSLESGGTTVTAAQVVIGKDLKGQSSWITTSPKAGNVQTSQGAKTTDPLADNANMDAAFAKLGQFTAPYVIPVNYSMDTGNDWNLTNGSPLPAGVTLRGNVYTAAPNKGSDPYAIRNLTIANDRKLVFDGSSTVTISGTIKLGGGVDFGNCTCLIRQDFSAGSTPVILRRGSYTFGGDIVLSPSIDIGVVTLYVIGSLTTQGDVTADGGNLVVAEGMSITYTTFQWGPGNVLLGRDPATGLGLKVGSGTFITAGGGYFSSQGALQTDGGSEVSIGNADIRIGNAGCGSMPNANCNSIVAGGTSLTFGDGPFSANGNIRINSSGTLTLGDAATHYINGDLVATGSVNFGTGLYVINGSLTNRTSGTMRGTDVTFVLKDTLNLSGGAGLSVAAPTSNAGGGLTNIVFASQSSAASALSGGATATVSGAFYMPNASLTLGGGASMGGGGQCLSFIVNVLTLSGGTTAASTCTNLATNNASGSAAAGGGSAVIALVR